MNTGELQALDAKIHKLFFGDETQDSTPHYSTDIAAAWLVVEKLRKRDVFLDIGQTRRDPMEWTAYFRNPNWVVGKIGYAETAPLAICYAALKVVQE